MKIKTISVLTIIVILFSTASVSSNQLVKADTNIIYIKSDGTVDPIEAPISTADGMLFVLTADIDGVIWIQKDGITLDGQSHILKGTLSESGARAHVLNVRKKGWW